MHAAYYLLGVILGAGSSVIPGPCGLAVIDAATRLGVRRAVATAIGAGLGDLAYGALGVLGVGHMLAGDPQLVCGMLAASGAVMIAYGLACACRRHVDRPQRAPALGGILVGFATLIGNPGALVMWAAVGLQLGAARCADQCLVVIGIGSGSLVWFVAMAHVSARGTRALGERMHRVVQLVGGSMAIYGALSLARALTS
jgi:threonine/homoserine/homoserine lactone efflux protein